VSQGSPHPAAAPVIEVAAGVIFREGQLLITQRYADAHLGGLWEFPGGKREPGETFEHCLTRELREELGIEVDVGQLLEQLDQDYGDKQVHLRFFHCRWLKHEPQLLGCAALKWITLAQLEDYDFPAADERLLLKLKNSPALWV
jgi:mutator protein MutT